MRCLMTAWSGNEQAIKNWLMNRTGDHALAQDLHQELFIKALQNKERFCTLVDAKSWLFKMAKNSVIDHHRKSKLELAPVCESQLQEQPHYSEPVVNLLHCLPRVLCELSDDDKEVIEQCDMQGVAQADYAQRKGLSLSAVKSRVQRARQKLREQMVLSCQVTFDRDRVHSFTPRN